MHIKPLLFTGIFLSINDNKLEKETFEKELPPKDYYLPNNQRVHLFRLEYSKSYLKINFADGSAMPRHPFVIKENQDLELQPNPRLNDQVEPKENFAIIDFETSFLWLSNSTKRGVLLDFLKSIFKNALIVAKDVYDENNFIEAIRTLDKIKISAAPNLFTQTATLSASMADEINQYDAVEATLEFKYRKRLINRVLHDKITSLFKNRSNFNGIVISGRDEKNLGMLFNSDGFSRKIVIKANVDANEMFNPEEVFNKIIAKIDEEKK